jgi:D-alanyl-D-alanine carboxypeptidase/D-alanyl-D-alanine-endopeptidase (penicillin-binding protein 4)
MAKRKGKPTLENGIKAIIEFWENKGLDNDAIFLHDGSGLSPRNSISSEALSKLFYLVSKDNTLYPSFFKSLSVAGKSGTLGGMLKNSPAMGNVYAKSGYIDRVLTYTGYVHASSGNKFAFSIMVNNFKGKTWPVRQKLEKLFESLYKL